MEQTVAVILTLIIGILIGLVAGMYIQSEYTKSHLPEYGYVKVN